MLALSLLIAPFVLNIITLHDGHYWGEDFAQFIICAGNIVSGRPYTQGVMLDLPVVFPPGYPLILAPLVYLFGLDFIALKSLNIVFLFFLVWGTYRLTKARSDRSSGYGAALFLAWMSYLFLLKQHIESDLPFSACVVWAAYYLERYERKKRGHDFGRALGLMSLALLVRSAGAALFLGALIHLAFSRERSKGYRDISIMVGIFLATFLFQTIFFGAAPGAWSELYHDIHSIPKNIIANMSLLSSALLWVIIPPYTVLTSVYNKFLGISVHASYFLVFAVAGAFIWQALWKRLSALYAIFCAYFFLIFLWLATYKGPVEHFSRFMLPLVPFFFVGAAVLFKRYRSGVFHSSVRVLFLVLLALNVWNMVWTRDLNDDGLRKPAAQDLFAWVKSHVRQDEAVLFTYPRALSLMAQVKSGMFRMPQRDIPEWWLEQNNFRYAIVSRKEHCVISELIVSRHDLFELAWMNRGYLVYRFVGSGKLAPPKISDSDRVSSFSAD